MSTAPNPRRRGGPLDTTIVTTHCLSCGQQFTKPLRWFSGRSERRCPACDGQLDRKPLEALLKSTAERLKAAIQGREGL